MNFVWGFLLWLIGYVLGVGLFSFVPPAMIGWVIMPIGALITVRVAWKVVKGKTLKDYAVVGLIWTLIAIVCDYLFLVLLFKPADGYYKLDVYIYYALTFLIPVAVGWRKAAVAK